MSVYVSLLNDVAVSLFGSVLAASFCNALDTRKNRRFFWCGMVVIQLIQALAYCFCDNAFLQKIYPIMTHLPLWLMLSAITRKLLWPGISVLSAYLCCQLRRWIGLLTVALFSGGVLLQETVELIITLPLLYLLLRFVSPAVCKLKDHSKASQCRFGVIPAVYYVFDYLTVVYTDLLISGSPVVVEFMPFVCCVAYLVFLLYHSAEEQKRSQLEQVQKSMNLQLTQAVREISALRESQALTRQYRHDLHHHLQYLLSCIKNGQLEQAQTYISEICAKIEAQKVQQYCENEAANLILSAFAGRAEKAGIRFQVQGALPAFIMVSDSDLCVLLSNALENALNACQPFVDAGMDSHIEVQFYERSGKLFLQVTNPCKDTVHFENGLPVSDRPGHGIGVQSICAIVGRYGGVYAFLVQDGQFILRLSL